MIGTGVQAHYQLLATCAVRPIAQVLAWDPNEAGLMAFGKAVAARDLAFETPGIEAVARQADILISVTPSRSALVKREWIRPGTHINAMGADTAGKQELDPELVAAATVIVDDVEQAISIGECQHAFKLDLISREDLRRTLGAVVVGAFARSSATEITLFDGTGIALQDLAVAELAYRRAKDKGQGEECEL